MKRKVIELIITEDLAGLRIDRALALHPDILSRSKASQMVISGDVTLYSKKLKPSHSVKLGESYIAVLPKKLETEITPYDLALDIPYEDDSLIIVNKPSGLVVHPAAGHHGDTLVNALISHNKNLSAGSSIERPGLVHRIDKDTSGLLVIAKNEKVHMGLAEQFKNKTVHRVYYAVTYGVMTANKFKFESSLSRHPTQRKKFSSQPKGKVAITHVEVQASNPLGFNLVHCRLETGRTHQIRVHLSENKTPIVGDPIYGHYPVNGPKFKTQIQNILNLVPHLMLHAAELGFEHPITKERKLFKSNWPQETISLLKALDFL